MEADRMGLLVRIDFSWVIRFLAQVLEQLLPLDNTAQNAPAIGYYTGEIRAHILRTVRFVIAATRGDGEGTQSWYSSTPGKALPEQEEGMPCRHSLKRFEDADDEYNCFYYAPIISYTVKALRDLNLTDDRNEIPHISAQTDFELKPNRTNRTIRDWVQCH